jgi:hypothetical protein
LTARLVMLVAIAAATAAIASGCGGGGDDSGNGSTAASGSGAGPGSGAEAGPGGGADSGSGAGSRSGGPKSGSRSGGAGSGSAPGGSGPGAPPGGSAPKSTGPGPGGSSGKRPGAGSGGSKAAPSSPAKAQFIKRANAACGRERARAFREAVSYGRKHRSESKSASKLVTGLVNDVFLPKVERQNAAIAKLGAPAGDEARIDAFLADQAKGIDEVAGLSEVKSLDQMERHFAAAGKLARTYGIAACANG